MINNKKILNSINDTFYYRLYYYKDLNEIELLSLYHGNNEIQVDTVYYIKNTIVMEFILYIDNLITKDYVIENYINKNKYYRNYYLYDIYFISGLWKKLL